MSASASDRLRACVVGGGVIGGGWAARFLLNGWDVAVYDPQQSEEVQDLVDRADRAMYRVKRRGKGGIEIAGPDNGAGS